ncbi:MAG TPA: hypothetical protein VMV18_05825, partial [bacterium]|nr:hypothetical protein [bacterium]
MSCLSAGCLHTNRPVELAAADRNAPPVMNERFLRGGRLVVEVDWLAGCAPNDGALDALRAWLARETARAPGDIEVRRGREVARGAGDGLNAVTSTVLANAHRAEDAYFVYVLYWDHFEKYRGLTFPGIELDARIDFPVVAMMTDAVRHDSMLWMTRRKVESAVLVHEFGHVAGLVSSGRRV